MPVPTHPLSKSTQEVLSSSFPIIESAAGASLGHSVFHVVAMNLLEGFHENKINTTGFLKGLSLKLRGVSTEFKRLVDRQTSFNVFPIIENLETTNLSPSAFFRGPGLALKKLIKKLPTVYRALLIEMFSLMPKEDFQNLFTADRFPCDANQFLCERSNYQFSGYSATKFKFAHSENQNGLTLNFLNKPNSPQIILLGHFNPLNPSSFSGIVLVKTFDTSKVFAVNDGFPGVNAENFTSENLFSLAKGNVFFSMMGGVINKVWRNVQLSAQGLKNRTTGDLMFRVSGNVFAEIKAVRFNEDGALIDGTVGLLKRYFTSGTTQTWQGAFSPDGSMKPNTIGDLTVFLPDGQSYYLTQVVMGPNNRLMPGQSATFEHQYPCGKKQIVKGVIIQADSRLDLNGQVEVDTYSASGRLLKTQRGGLKHVSPVSCRLFSE